MVACRPGLWSENLWMCSWLQRPHCKHGPGNRMYHRCPPCWLAAKGGRRPGAVPCRQPCRLQQVGCWPAARPHAVLLSESPLQRAGQPRAPALPYAWTSQAQRERQPAGRYWRTLPCTSGHSCPQHGHLEAWQCCDPAQPWAAPGEQLKLLPMQPQSLSAAPCQLLTQVLSVSPPAAAQLRASCRVECWRPSRVQPVVADTLPAGAAACCVLAVQGWSLCGRHQPGGHPPAGQQGS